MTIEITNPYQFFTDKDDSTPLEDGNIYIGTAGLDAKTNQISVYWDSALTIAAAQPINTLIGYPDRTGTPSKFYTTSDYSITVENKIDEVVYSSISGNVEGGSFISDAIIAKDTVAEIVANANVLVGQVFSIEERGSALFDVISGTTGANGYDLIQCTGVANLQLSLRLDRVANVKSFGALGNSLGVTTGETDDTAPIKAAIATGLDVYAPQGVYAVSETLELSDGQMMYGDGLDLWTFTFDQTQKFEASGTHFRFIGTGTKDFTADQVSNVYQGGGVKNGQSLLDFTNSDASGTTPATSKSLSVAIKLNNNSQLKNIRVYPSKSGISGYQDIVNTTMADDWDIGVLVSNVIDTYTHNTQIVGYWRMAALVLLESDDRSSAGICERNVFDNCTLQGNVGLAIRACDTRQILSTTATTVTIGYDTGHQMLASGSFRISGGDTVTYTGITYDAAGDGSLTLTGLSQDVTGSGDIRAGNSAYGFSGTNFTNTNIWSLTHSSGNAATGITGADSAETKCMEISGYPMRAIRFIGSRCMNGYDLINTYFHSAYDLVFEAHQFENGQMVASPFHGDSSAVYPSGDTRNLSITDTDFSASRFPYISGDVDNGFDYFEPRNLTNLRDNVLSKYGGNTQIFSPTGQRTHIVGELDGVGGLQVLDSGTTLVTDGSAFRAEVDGVGSLGTSGGRFSVVYAVDGTINTSDERHKKDIKNLTVTEAIIAKELQSLIRVFRWKNNDEVKHVGVIAQEVVKCFDNHGLNATDYGIVNYDKWEEDEISGKSGDIFGVNYNELLCFIISAI